MEDKGPGGNDPATGERSPTAGVPKGTVISSLVWLALIVLYVVFRAVSPLAEPALTRGSVIAEGLGVVAYPLLFAVLVLALLTPLTSSSVVILAAAPLLGPWQVFVTALSAAAVAAIASYNVGRRLSVGGRRAPWLGRRIERARRFADDHTRGPIFLAFMLKTFPSPLYDASGYLFGVMGVPFVPFLIASTLGSAVPFAILCSVGAG